MLDISKLKNLLPIKMYQELPEIMAKFQINTIFCISHFLGQAAHESSNFTKLVENMNYSSDRLRVVFPKYFNEVGAILYANRPEAIGSRVYASRMGNGNEVSKEGFKFRGRGVLHITGKSNYLAFNKFVSNVDLIKNPDLVASTFALTSGAWFWLTNNINPIADKGMTLEVSKQITKKIQGGSLGANERFELFNKFYNILK